MRVKITIEIERNGYTATETVEYIDRTPADITAEMAGQLQRLQAACNLAVPQGEGTAYGDRFYGPMTCDR